MINNISLRIFLPFGFIAVAAIVLLSYYLVALPIGHEEAIRNAEVNFSRKLASIQGRYNNLLSTDNIIAVNQDLIMTAQDDFQSISYIMILDGDNTVLFTSEATHVGLEATSLPFNMSIEQNTRARNTGLFYFEREEGTANLIGYAGLNYFDDEGQQKNTLVVVLDTTNAAEQSLSVTFSTLLIVFTSLVFFGVLNMIMMHYKIHERVKTLLKMAEEIGQSTQTGKHSLTGKDELGQISNQLEHMALMLAQREGHLQAMRYQAEKVSENKSDFLSTMSHEIRTPLTGLIGFLELAIKKFQEQDDDKFLDISLQSAQSLLALVNEILDLSRLENNKIVVEQADVICFDFLENLVKAQSAVAHQKGLYLELDFSGDQEQAIMIDKKLLTQVLINIINNAIKFSHAGGITVRARLSRLQEGHLPLEIEIADTGIGIPKGQITRLFDRYEQIEEAQVKASHAGTGLGLSIVKEISRLLHINISLESEVNSGTTFKLKMNVPQGHPDIVDITKVIEEEIADTAVKFKGNVMIVDDNHINRLLLGKLIQDKVASFIVLESGELALDYMKRHYDGLEEDVDMILMDINMPGLNGDEAQKKIREISTDYKDLPIIAVTANTIKGAREKFISRGMTDFISKPIDIDEIFKILSMHLKLERDDNVKNMSVKKVAANDVSSPPNANALDNLLDDL